MVFHIAFCFCSTIGTTCELFEASLPLGEFFFLSFFLTSCFLNQICSDSALSNYIIHVSRGIFLAALKMRMHIICYQKTEHEGTQSYYTY
jgi:hypothetical protein